MDRKALDRVRDRPTLTANLGLAAVLEPRPPLRRVIGSCQHLFTVFKRVDVKHPRRVLSGFDLSCLVYLLVPDTRIVGLGVKVVLVAEEPVHAVGFAKVVVQIVDFPGSIHETSVVGL